MQQLNVNLDQILEIAFLGARRANVFMALGTNAAEDPAQTKYSLPTLLNFSLLPEEVSQEDVQAFKREFGTWVVGAALRDLIDHTSVFLDQVFEVCWLFEQQRRRTKSSHVNQERKQFLRKSASDKLRYLGHAFALNAPDGPYLDDLKNARNCLTHRRGVVGLQDCQDGAAMTLRWKGHDFLGRLPDGRAERIPAGHRGSFSFSDAATLEISVSERARVFTLGTLLKLEPHELAEMCWMTTEIARQLIASVRELAIRCGIPVRPA